MICPKTNVGNLVISLFGAFLSGVFSVCTSCASKLLKWTTLVEYYTDVMKIRVLSDSFNKKQVHLELL